MGYTSVRLGSFARRVTSSLYATDTCNTLQAEGLFSVCCLPKALPHGRAGSISTYVGNYTYILDSRVVESALVRRGDVSSRRKDCEAEGYKEEGGTVPSNLYTTLALPWAHNARKCMGSNWI